MLRRVVRVLRIMLFGFGLAFLMWLPFSCLYAVWLSTPWPGDHTVSSCRDGIVVIRAATRVHNPGSNDDLRLKVERISKRGSFTEVLVPYFFSHDVSGFYLYGQDDPARFAYATRGVVIPLWLLAVLCLAWPVTSLLLARRRRKGRGFALEPAPGAAPPGGEAPTSNLPPP